MANTHAVPTRTFFLLIALGSSLWVMNGAEAAQTLQQRLQAIYAMSAEEMASTSAFTRRAYEAQIEQIDRMQNPQVREIVRDLVLKPRATGRGAAFLRVFGWTLLVAFVLLAGGLASLDFSGCRP